MISDMPGEERLEEVLNLMTSNMKGEGGLNNISWCTPKTDPFFLQGTVFITMRMQHEETCIPLLPINNAY